MVSTVQLINLLNDNGPMTRDELCAALGFEQYNCEYTKKYTRTGAFDPQKVSIKQYKKRTTVHDNLVKLQKKKIVEKFSKNNGKRGAPKVFWKLVDGKNDLNSK